MYAVCHYCGKIVEDAEFKVHYSLTIRKHHLRKRKILGIHMICPYCKGENISEYVVKNNPKKLYCEIDRKQYRVLPTDDLMEIAVEIEQDKTHSEKLKEKLDELMRKWD